MGLRVEQFISNTVIRGEKRRGEERSNKSRKPYASTTRETKEESKEKRSRLRGTQNIFWEQRD